MHACMHAWAPHHLLAVLSRREVRRLQLREADLLSCPHTHKHKHMHVQQAVGGMQRRKPVSVVAVAGGVGWGERGATGAVSLRCWNGGTGLAGGP